jgi:hypothetical protein
MIASVPCKIRTQHFPNTIQQHYRYTKLLATILKVNTQIVFVSKYITYTECPWSRYYFFQVAPQIVHEAEWTSFQTHCCSEKCCNAGNRTRDPCVSSQTL